MKDGNLEICGISTEFMAKVWMSITGEVLGVDEYGICLGSDYLQTSVSTAVCTIKPWDLRIPSSNMNILCWRDIEMYSGSNIMTLNINESYCYTVNEMGQLVVAINQSQNEINILCYERLRELLQKGFQDYERLQNDPAFEDIPVDDLIEEAGTP